MQENFSSYRFTVVYCNPTIIMDQLEEQLITQWQPSNSPLSIVSRSRSTSGTSLQSLRGFGYAVNWSKPSLLRLYWVLTSCCIERVPITRIMNTSKVHVTRSPHYVHTHFCRVVCQRCTRCTSSYCVHLKHILRTQIGTILVWQGLYISLLSYLSFLTRITTRRAVKMVRQTKLSDFQRTLK